MIPLRERVRIVLTDRQEGVQTNRIDATHNISAFNLEKSTTITEVHISLKTNFRKFNFMILNKSMNLKNETSIMFKIAEFIYMIWY